MDQLAENAAPLAGIVVADFSRVLAGPYATMVLGDLGATVIKVESPQGDDTRYWAPPAYEGEAVYYSAVNRNKNSIVLDLKDPDDAAVAKDIAANADVFVHNFKPGSIEKLGFGYEDVKALRADIIYAHITGYGSQEGGRDLPGYDVLVQGMAGLMSMNGEPDGKPVRSGVSIFDLTCGMMTTVGIIAAIRHRDRTGEGQKVENNLMANALFTMSNQYQEPATIGTSPFRHGDEHASIYPYNAFPTADGDLIVVAANNGQFERLTTILGVPELAVDERFNTPQQRNVNRRELKPLLEKALAARGKDEWFELLRANGLPSAPVQTVGEGLETARKLGLEPTWEPAGGGLTTIRNSLRMSATPPTYRKAPPKLGADGDDVRAWLAERKQQGRTQQRGQAAG